MYFLFCVSCFVLRAGYAIILIKTLIPDNRSYLKNVFWLNIFVGAAFPILDPPEADLRFETWPRRDLEPKSYF